MTKYFLIALGGAAGAILRYIVSGYVQRWTNSVEFPYGTLVVNLAGCLTIGVLSYLADARGVFTAESRAFVFVGLLGAFTTFSTFGNETMALFRDGENALALFNLGAHLVLGLGAVWGGRALTSLIVR